MSQSGQAVSNGKPKGQRAKRKPAENGNGSESVKPDQSADKDELAPFPDADGLSYRQRLFAMAYLGEAQGNQTQAARIAGYPFPEVAASRLIRNAKVQALIVAKTTEAALTGDDIQALLSDAALGPTPDMFDPRDGRPDMLRIIRAGRVHLVRRYTPTKNGPSIEFVCQQTAQITLAKMRGMLVERHHVQVDVTLYDDPSQLDAIARGEDPGPPRQRPQLTGPVIDTTYTTQETAQDDPGSIPGGSVDRKTD